MIESLKQFKDLNQDEKWFCIFEALKGLSRDDLDKRYASKQTEKIVFGAVKLILVAVVLGAMSLIIIKG